MLICMCSGLTEQEVQARRRKYGLNQMKEEKENLILKFFSYFVGPIQFVMEVSIDPAILYFFPHAPRPGCSGRKFGWSFHEL